MADIKHSPLMPDRDGAGPYVIEVYGKLARDWGRELGMQLSYTRTEWGTISILTGSLPDQAALLGALGRLAMWGHLIIIVRYEVGRPGSQTAACDTREW